MSTEKKIRLLVLSYVAVLLLAACRAPASGTTGDLWSVAQNGSVLKVSYGAGTNSPQYAALHLDSSYLRLVYGPDSGWGTSVILLPVFWSKGTLYQGAPVNATWQAGGVNLVVSLTGTIGGLDVTSNVILSPPTATSLMAQVTMQVSGSVPIDSRQGEAFKPVMLSSMKDSTTIWDAQSAYVECQTFPIPSSGFIIPTAPPTQGTIFGLEGGTSSWKTNAPTIEIELSQPLQVTGWVTPDDNPNDDNVAYWAATDHIVNSFSYTIKSEPSPSGCRAYLPVISG